MSLPDRSVNHPPDQDFPVRGAHLAAEVVGRYTARRRSFLSKYFDMLPDLLLNADLTSPARGDCIPLPLQPCRLSNFNGLGYEN